MHDLIRYALVWVRAVLALRPSGRHRAVPGFPTPYPGPSRPVAGAVYSPTVNHQPVPPRPYDDSTTRELHTVPRLPLDSELPALVRPSMVADERRHQRSKSVPRVELLCAPHGMVVIR